jgi:hypothetical protein
MEIAKEDSDVPTVWVYVNPAAPVGSQGSSEGVCEFRHSWAEAHDPEGVAFEYPPITGN